MEKMRKRLLQAALAALKKLYWEFGIAFTYGKLAPDPQEHGKLVEIIASFGPMPCHIMTVDHGAHGEYNRGRHRWASGAMR